jgi:hypothetical protein
MALLEDAAAEEMQQNECQLSKPSLVSTCASTTRLCAALQYPCWKQHQQHYNSSVAVKWSL